MDSDIDACEWLMTRITHTRDDAIDDEQSEHALRRQMCPSNAFSDIQHYVSWASSYSCKNQIADLAKEAQHDICNTVKFCKGAAVCERL